MDIVHAKVLAGVKKRWQDAMPSGVRLELCSEAEAVALQAVRRLLLPSVLPLALPPRRYGLCFCSRSQAFARCYGLLREAAMHASIANGQRVVHYYGSMDGAGKLYCPSLQSDLTAGLLCGVIYLCLPEDSSLSVLPDADGVPQIRVGGSTVEASLRLPFVEQDNRLFLARAVAWLQAQGCSRLIAANSISQRTTPWLSYLQEAVGGQAGIQLVDEPLVALPADSDYEAFALVERIVHAKAARPDALLLLDDRLVGRVSSALLLHGVDVPGELKVISSCSLPVHEEPLLPLCFLGLPAELLLAACMALIDSFTAEQAPAAQLLIPPLFAAEWQAILDVQAGFRSETV